MMGYYFHLLMHMRKLKIILKEIQIFDSDEVIKEHVDPR